METIWRNLGTTLRDKTCNKMNNFKQNTQRKKNDLTLVRQRSYYFGIFVKEYRVSSSVFVFASG